jgi:GTP-binding protein SAR1
MTDALWSWLSWAGGAATATLRWLGVLGTIQGTVVFLGLDNAGKTTLLHVLGGAQKVMQHAPTQKPTVEEYLVTPRLRFTLHDLGGHELAQRLWQQYATRADALVFLVDAADPGRLPEAAAALAALLDALDDDMDVPLAILGNKIDAPGALAEEALAQALGVATGRWGKQVAAASARPVRPPRRVRPMELFMCSVVRRQGYRDAFDWLAQFLPP